MNILALDTSTEYLSLAFWRDGEVSSHEQHAGQAHSSLLLPQLHIMLENYGLELKDFDGIAFGAGPGSFTGLRIGCGVAQGLAFGAGLPVLGISTLLAMAVAVGLDRSIVCLDARMGEVYHAAYMRQKDGWLAVHEPGLYAPGGVPKVQGEGWCGIGSGWSSYADQLRACYRGQLTEEKPDVFPHAREIAMLAAPMFERGLGQPAQEAAPVYIRNKVALKISERAKA